MNKETQQRGSGLIGVLIAIAALAAVAIGSGVMMSSYVKASKRAVDMGIEEDLRQYLRSTVDCRNSAFAERATCNRGGLIQGRTSTNTPLFASAAGGRNFNGYNVKMRCQNGPQGTDITAEVKGPNDSHSRELFTFPIACDLCGPNPGWGDPQTFGGWVTGYVNQVRRNCGFSVLSNRPWRRGWSSGGGFRWTAFHGQDLATLRKVCNELGYDTYDSSTCYDNERSGRYPSGKCNFHSPSDNYNRHWDAGINGWRDVRDPPKYDWNWVYTITCSGKRR